MDIDPLSAEATDMLELKALDAVIPEVKKRVYGKRWIKEKTINRIERELRQAILLDYWSAGRTHDINEVEQEVNKKLLALLSYIEPLEESPLWYLLSATPPEPLELKLTYCKYYHKVTVRQEIQGDKVLPETTITNKVENKTVRTEKLEPHPLCKPFPPANAETQAGITEDIDTLTIKEIDNAADAISEILTKVQNAVDAFMKLPQWSDQAAFVDDMLKILRESLTDGVEEIDVLIEKLGISTDKPEL